MEVKTAIRKGYLHTQFDKEALDEVKKIRVAEEFFKKRKDTLGEYDYLNTLATRTEISHHPREAIKAAFPLFERFLIVDGRRRAFDEIDRVPGNILEEEIKAVEQSVKDFMRPEEVEVLCSISPSESYEIYRTKLLVGLVRKYSLGNPDTRVSNEEIDEVVTRCFLSNRSYFDKCVRGVLPLMDSSRLASVLRSKEEQDAQKLSLIEKLAKSELPNKNDILIQIANITKFRHCLYFEDAQRHSEIDFYGDYLVRVAVAESLFNLRAISDKRPFEHPQQKLYDLARKLVIGRLK